jgi:hypothetical protein
MVVGMDDPTPMRPRRALKSVPPKPKLRRTSHITIRLSAEERAQLDERAARAGLMNGSYVRQAVFGAPMPRQVRRPPVERQALARLLGSLGHVGANLNQLAHRFNSGLPTDRQEVLDAIRSLGPVREAILRALGMEP